jgi:hypothetical protein
MARPIKATPILYGQASYDFQKCLIDSDKKKVKISLEKPSPEIKKKIINDGPKW